MKRFPPFIRRSSSAFALVLVLVAVILCALMILILMERGSTGLKSASSYSDGVRVRALSDMVQNLVQARIHDATTLNQGIDTPVEERDTWASQPGAIRVYTPSGNLREIFKLYSSETPRTTDPDLAQDVPGEESDPWYDRPSEYTDLNEPVRDGTTAHYPIVNPDAAALNPGATGIIEGFSIEDAPMENSEANKAPMPVRWIYVLQDGTLCQLGDDRIDRDGNPIVGRIAFWTDDETAKVNINTASPVMEASYWDIPRTRSDHEFNQFSMRQPAQNEFQRYPGHPAMVSLRSILGDLENLGEAEYFDLTPRYYWGGSEEGDKLISDNRISLLKHKEDRAYVTVDELLFRSMPDNDITLRDYPTRKQIEGLHFFLSASSRAPELNLFGQPRVSIWPVYGNPDDPGHGDTRRTPYDRLIAFCSTIGGKPYYFTREEPLNPSHDYYNIRRNQELYAYLQRLTAESAPGFEGSQTFVDKYGNDRDQILTEIFDYIRIVNLNETFSGRDPGFQSYTSNWKIERADDAETAVNVTRDYPIDGELRGAGLVVPIEIGDTRGMGRFPVIAEVGLMFVTHSEKKPGEGDPDDPVPEAPDPNNLEQLEAMLVIETITPAFGYMPWIGKDLYFELESSTLKLSVGDREIQMFPNGVNHNNDPIFYPPLLQGGMTPGGYDGAAYVSGRNHDQVSGGYRFFSAPLDLQPGEPEDTHFSVYGTNDEGVMLGGNVKINILVGSTEVQSYTFDFDAFTLPLPTRSEEDYRYAWRSDGTSKGHPWWRARFHNFHGPFLNDVLQGVELKHGDARLVAGTRDVPAPFFSPHELYGTSSLAHGMRSTDGLMVARLWSGASFGSYFDDDLPLASDDERGSDPAYGPIMRSVRPKIPSGITGLREGLNGQSWSGDFDNGIGRFLDGPFINKPDEGMMHTSDGTSHTATPYDGWMWSLANGLFSPLRQIPSAVMFGSLPTGVKAQVPWRTLLFCPNPADPGHKGFEDPADHLLLDLFRMPVVEPYAISGPASTDGKINMNYAIAPFSYIRRASSWYALLEPLKIFVIHDNDSDTYKAHENSATRHRRNINIPETLEQFEERFGGNDLFRSATEICELFLIPEDSTLDQIADYWSVHRPTGDNSREKPYAELYPKLTTQSNTYRVHMRVQVLPRSEGVPAGQEDFEPLAEYRGSRLIERYLDPENPDFASVDPDEDNLNALYEYRVLETRRFNP